MSFAAGLVVGMVVGASVGLMVAVLCFAAAEEHRP